MLFMLCIWWRQVAKDASDRGPGTKDFVPGPAFVYAGN